MTLHDATDVSQVKKIVRSRNTCIGPYFVILKGIKNKDVFRTLSNIYEGDLC